MWGGCGIVQHEYNMCTTNNAYRRWVVLEIHTPCDVHSDPPLPTLPATCVECFTQEIVQVVFACVCAHPVHHNTCCITLSRNAM